MFRVKLSWDFNFSLSVIVFCDKGCISNGDDVDTGLNNLFIGIRFVGVLCLFFGI